MKKTIVASTILLATAYASLASANNGLYVTGSLGAAIIKNHDSKIIDHYDNETFSALYSFKNKTSGVFAGGAALGYDFNAQHQIPARIEINTTLRSNANGSTHNFIDDENNHVRSKNKIYMDSYMINGFYDLYNSSDFVPYITAGIGIAHLQNTLSIRNAGEYSGDHSTAKTNFAWGLGTGVRYTATNHIIIDAGYKYIDGGKVTKKDIYSDGYTKYRAKAVSHDVMLGVTYQF